MYQSASFSRTAAFSMAGPSSSSMTLVISNISSKLVGKPPPTARRSFISVVSDTFQPSPTSPSRWLSGMRTLSK